MLCSVRMPIGNSNGGGGPIWLFGLEGRADGRPPVVDHRHVPRLDIGYGLVFYVRVDLSSSSDHDDNS
jgi:hypothetical protein